MTSRDYSTFLCFYLLYCLVFSNLATWEVQKLIFTRDLLFLMEPSLNIFDIKVFDATHEDSFDKFLYPTRITHMDYFFQYV